MSQKFFRPVVLGLALLGVQGTTFGQGWHGFGDHCNICAPLPPPQPCYQQIPVTEMRECRQVVQRPVCETKYVDQQCTEYRPVCETRTCQVPQVTYQTVNECHTVQRDMGCWQTSYQCRYKPSPCQYDNRPGLFGMLNRTGYSMRMAFTPDVVAQRHWVPNVVTTQVPTSRQVAVNTVRTVNYQVSKMVPYTTTRKVAVNTVRMVAQEIVTQHPVTVMKTVPYGSTYAIAPSTTGTASALAPVPDSLPTARTPTFDDREALLHRENTTVAPLPKPDRPLPDSLRDDASGFESTPRMKVLPKAKGQSLIQQPQEAPTADRAPSSSEEHESVQLTALPSAVRVGRWVARRPIIQGPVLAQPEVSVADAE